MKKILVIHTGGTIGMHRTAEGVLVPMDEDTNLVDYIPAISRIAEVDSLRLFQIDSSDMTPNNWVKMAETIKEKYDEYDGFVILHGTDTMAYSATALSFMLTGLGKPVVFTGSQVPMIDIASDGQNNLMNAIRIACDNVAEVCIMFGNFLLRGNRSTKLKESRFDSFESPNFKPLAEVGIEFNLKGHCFRRHGDEITLKTNLVTDVAVIQLFPGITNEQILAMVPPRSKGVMIEGYGSGNIPLGAEGIQQAITEIIEQDIIVVINPQCIFSSTKRMMYAGVSFLKKQGALSSGDMTTEASIVKLMWVLGQTENAQDAKEMFTKNISGELTEPTS